MKKIILFAMFMLITAFAICQKIIIKNDTLYVPVQSCKYIKIGEKVYKVKVTLEEEPEPLTLSGSPIYWPATPYDTTTHFVPYTYNTQSPHTIKL